jgi:hypothetical protein
MGIFDYLDDDDDDLYSIDFSSSSRKRQEAHQKAHQNLQQRTASLMRRAEERLNAAEKNLDKKLYKFKEDDRIRKTVPRSTTPDEREERVKVKATPQSTIDRLQAHIDASSREMTKKEESIRDALLKRNADKIKQAAEPEPEPMPDNSPNEIVVHDLSDKDKELLTRVLESSLKMTDVFFDVSREDRQVLLEKLQPPEEKFHIPGEVRG